MSDRRWLSPDEAAERVPHSRKSIYGACRRREIPGARKVAGLWCIPEDGLEAWIESGETADVVDSPPRRRRGGVRPPSPGSVASLRSIEAEVQAQ